MSEEKKNNILKTLNDAVLDFTEKTFGASGREFMEKTQKQVNDFNAATIKSFVDFTDKVLESTKLADNDMVQKSSKTVKDLLRQFQLLEEESEDDF